MMFILLILLIGLLIVGLISFISPELFETRRGKEALRLELLSNNRDKNAVNEPKTRLYEDCNKISCRRSNILRSSDERKVLAELPILLESLILLVESGNGILPAIYKLLEASPETKPTIVRYYLRQIHDLSMRGIPFEEALQVAADDCPYASLRHFFLHLDIGVNVGGKIGNSLRSLANHSHNEWKLSVEARVRKLENLVVFPVFGSVIGLVLLTAAVPLISLLDLKDRLDATQGISDENQILEAKQ